MTNEAKTTIPTHLQYWKAVPNDLIGGWCVITMNAHRKGLTPATGADELASFASEVIANHIAEVHNASLTLHDRWITMRDLDRRIFHSKYPLVNGIIKNIVAAFESEKENEK